MRTRERDSPFSSASVETSHHSITPGHLGYVAAKLGRKIKWDPKAEVTTDEEAMKLLNKVEYREPWKFPG